MTAGVKMSVMKEAKAKAKAKAKMDPQTALKRVWGSTGTAAMILIIAAQEMKVMAATS